MRCLLANYITIIINYTIHYYFYLAFYLLFHLLLMIGILAIHVSRHC